MGKQIQPNLFFILSLLKNKS